MLSKVCGSTNERGTEEFRNLYNEELLDLYAPPNSFRAIKSRSRRRNGHVRQYGGEYELMEETRRKAQLVRSRPKREDKINVYLKETGWEGAEWINLAQDKDKSVAHTVENHRVAFNAENFLSGLRNDVLRDGLHTN